MKPFLELSSDCTILTKKGELFGIATIADIRAVIKINDAIAKRLVDELVKDKIIIKKGDIKKPIFT